jgi:hypothetical protein
MSRRRYQILERIFIALIAIGIVGMFQSLQIDLYFWGFHLLLVGTLGFIILTHIPVRDEENPIDTP